jgi:hypothetical protein
MKSLNPYKTMFNKKLLPLCLLALLIFTGCNKEDDTIDPKGILIAKAGTDQEVKVGQNVTLDGSASSDSKNLPFTYQWEVVKKPHGSLVSISGSTTATPVFVPDVAGEYELELTIANENGQSKDKVLIKAEALTSYVLSEYITTPTVLEDRIEDPDIPDYIAEKTVVVTAQLTIKPGVTIAFAPDTRFDINSDGGIIIAKGEENKKIRLTGKEASKGYWRGMVIYSNSSLNTLEHVEISYTGSHFTLNNTKAALTLFGTGNAQASIKNSHFMHNEGYGLHAANGSIINSFSQNSFTENSEAGILLAADNVEKLDAASLFSNNNGRNAVEIFSSNISKPNMEETVWAGFLDKTPYHLLGELRVSSGWKLSPGVRIEVGNDQSIMIEDGGYLNAEGTLTEKILITGVSPTPGSWRGITFYSTSNMNILSHTEISYGGSNPIISGKKATIALVGNLANLIIRDSKLSGSAGYGIYARHTTRINDDVREVNIFENNVQENVFLEDEFE